MQEYCEKIKLPFTTTVRKWISNLSLNGPDQQQPNSSSEDTEQKDISFDNPSSQTMTNRENVEKTSVGNLATSPKQQTSSSSSGGKDVKNVTFKEPEYTKNSQSQDSPRKFTKISKAQMKEFREAFGFFDKDGDGSITKEELGIVMRSLGQFASEEELKEMLKEVDIDGDGTFSFDEFVQIVTNYAGSNSVTDEEQELRDAFRIFDKHNRGYISASDLRAVLHCLGEDLSEDEIEDMLKEVDVDGDGRIDFNEFVKALGEPDDQENIDDEVDIEPINLSQQ